MLNLVPRAEYAQGTGLTQSVFTIERSEPTSDEESWTAITISGGAACNQTYNAVEVGFTEGTYSPEQFGLRGPVICQDDLIYNLHAEQFLEAYIQSLGIRSKRSVENRLLKKYIDLSYKQICNASFTQYTGTDLTTSQATSELTQEYLDCLAVDLNESGASDPNSSGWITLGEDGPIYPLYIGQEMSQHLLTNNSDLRQDRRNADDTKGDMSMLFQRVGATRVIKNFRHVINLFPARYEYSAGAYTRVNTWLMSAKTKGTGAEINPAWKTATYEAAHVLTPWVMTEEIVKPVNSAAGLSWPVKSYFGEWEFIVGGNLITDGTCYDPRKKLGAHFGEYKHALRPIFRQYGRTILFKRCPCTNFDIVTCT